jgi:hypothetical protein
MRESAPRFLGLAAEATDDLRARAKPILDGGCDDPAVLYFASRAWVAKENAV